MPLNLDSCIAGVFTPGNIGASSGLPPVAPTVPSLDGAAPALVELATAIDTLDGFLGDLLHEAANAADSYSATGGAYEVLVSEPASAADVVSVPRVFNEAVGELAQATDAPLVYVPGVVSADVAEAAAANDVPDATVVPGASTWDLATVASVTLSGGDLVATNTGGTSTNQGARVASTSAKTTGKYYFEVTLTTLGGGGNTGVGIATTASTYANMGSNATTGNEVFVSGSIYANGSSTGNSLSARATGNVIGIAVDLGSRKAWFIGVNGSPSGQWNGSTASHNPNTGLGGHTVPAGTMAPICTFNAAGNVFTANFGASAFVGAVPTGFTAGWPG